MERRYHDVPVEVERRSNSHLNVLLDTMAAMIILNIGDDIIYANRKFLEKTGYTKEDIKTLKFSDLHPEYIKDLFLGRTIDRLNGSSDVPTMYEEIELICKGGKRIYCEVYPDVIYYEGKKAVIYTGIDRTEQRKAEKTLNEFFDFCPFPVFIMNKDNKVVRLSKHFEEIFNKTSSEMKGMRIEDLWGNENAGKIIAEDNIVFNTHKPHEFEKVMDGKHFITTKFPINGDLVGGFSVDITSRVETRKKLEESHKKYKELYNVLSSLLDVVPDMMWIYDKNKNITFANKALREYRLDENILETKECMVLAENEEAFIKEYNIGGNPIYVEILKQPLKDSDGNVIGCMGTVKDITDSLHVRDNIMKKLDELESETMKETKNAIESLNNTITTLTKKRWPLKHAG